MKKIQDFIMKYNRIIICLYFPFYMTWFMWLEKRNVHHTNIHCGLDDIIPFNVYFIIPYMLWFAYVVTIVLILALNPMRLKSYNENSPFYSFFSKRDPHDLYYCSVELMLGMTISLIIYTVFPNGQNLRPETLVINGPLEKMVATLYSSDTSTNVFPSLHVYNSIVVNHCLVNSAYLKAMSDKTRYIISGISTFLCIMICLSTMFLKQHSALDAVGAIVLFILICLLIERKEK